MSTRSKISELPPLVLIGLAILSLYLLYKLIMFLAMLFIYLGFIFFVFIDNLLNFNSANPIVLWGILGLLIGSIVGVVIAIKKYKLSKLLVLYPVSLFLVIITVLILVNKPTYGTGEYLPEKFSNQNEKLLEVPKKTYYNVTQTVNVRSRPSVTSTKLATLMSGTLVEFIENTYDNKNKTWTRIKCTNPQTGKIIYGYVNANYLRYSN